jgi:hypothetical protein
LALGAGDQAAGCGSTAKLGWRYWGHPYSRLCISPSSFLAWAGAELDSTLCGVGSRLSLGCLLWLQFAVERELLLEGIVRANCCTPGLLLCRVSTDKSQSSSRNSHASKRLAGDSPRPSRIHHSPRRFSAIPKWIPRPPRFTEALEFLALRFRRSIGRY